MERRRAEGFSLVELVVVILVIGIMSGVAAPRLFDTEALAHDNRVRQSLEVVRDAIEVFRATHNRWPGADGNQTTFKSELAPYLQRFPVLPVGRPQAQDDQVAMDAGTGTPAGVSDPSEGWRYYYARGVFIVNSNKRLASDHTVKYDQL